MLHKKMKQDRDMVLILKKASAICCGPFFPAR